MALPAPPLPAPRIHSVDAYRGFVMFLMLAEVLHLAEVAKKFPDSAFWKAIAFHTTHVEWAGCSLHDLIQPSFSFLVGVALTLSLTLRKGQGVPFWKSALRAFWRSFALVALGILLRSVGSNHTRTNFTFEDTLTQIGLGYFLLFLLANVRPRWWWWVALVVILVGYWAAFWLYQVPMDYEPHKVGVTPEWAEKYHDFTGWAAHWKKNKNLAWAVDTWFLNLFPRQAEFTHNSGGYATLSFIPTLATMIIGLLAGHLLQSRDFEWRKVLYLVMAGAIGLGVGRALDEYGICPVVKRIWSPSWVLFSGGWCLLILAVFQMFTAGIGYAGWTYPLRVIGANSILIYVIAEVPLGGWLLAQLQKHLPAAVFTTPAKWLADGIGLDAQTGATEQVLQGGLLLVVYWLFLWALYRRRVFVKI
jgi:heparan-alpha-glucosaminide N-acetyltransferase